MKNEGWICPKCGRVNAPWVDHCPCTNESNSNSYPFAKEIIKDYTSTFTDSPCKHCSNNSENGGSGICNCTLGDIKVTN